MTSEPAARTGRVIDAATRERRLQLRQELVAIAVSLEQLQRRRDQVRAELAELER